MRTYVKRVRAALDENDVAKAQQLLAQATNVIDRVAQKGVIKRETASRKVSRLTHAVRRVAAAK